MVKLAQDKFNLSKLKETKGRAEREIKGTLSTRLLADFRDKVVLPTSILQKTSGHDECKPTAFSVIKDKTSVNVERGRATTMRIIYTGDRQLVMTKNSSLRAFMESNGASSGALTPTAYIIMVFDSAANLSIAHTMFQFLEFEIGRYKSWQLPGQFNWVLGENGFI